MVQPMTESLTRRLLTTCLSRRLRLPVARRIKFARSILWMIRTAANRAAISGRSSCFEQTAVLVSLTDPAGVPRPQQLLAAVQADQNCLSVRGASIRPIRPGTQVGNR